MCKKRTTKKSQFRRNYDDELKAEAVLEIENDFWPSNDTSKLSLATSTNHQSGQQIKILGTLRVPSANGDLFPLRHTECAYYLKDGQECPSYIPACVRKAIHRRNAFKTTCR
jgi:hypothetical protein